MLTSQPSPITTSYDNAQFIAAAQEYFNYVHNTRFIHPDKSSLQSFIKKGVSFDVCITSPVSGEMLSLLACSIEMQNIFILRFLLEQGAQPLKPVSATQTKIPLQMICEKIKEGFYSTYRNNRFSREMYQSVLAHVKKFQPEFYHDLEKELSSAFATLYRRILNALQEAQRQGKKLLITMGEMHTSTLENILHAMIIEISVRLDIKNLMIEQSDKYLKLVEETYQEDEINDPYLIDHVWSPAIGNHLHGYQLGMTVVPIDLQRNPKDPDWNSSPEGTAQRESAMIEQILSHDMAHGFCTVGLAHMSKLIEHKRVHDTFHIFAINGSFAANTDDAFAFAYSSNIYQVSDLFSPDFINKADTMLAPVDGLNIVTKVANTLVFEDCLEFSSSEVSEENELDTKKQTPTKKCIIC
ncbi:MAG: hypothetical protein AB7I18_00815 [Candidatus Berkiella sp.]